VLIIPPLVLAAVTGFVSGLLLSIPVGPINLTIVNEGARNGFKWAFLIGLGSVVMEVIYCAIAFTGFASFFSQGTVRAAMEVFSFGFLLYLGIKFLAASSIEAVNRVEARIERRLHPHSAFMIGFVRVMGNPGVLLFWIVLAANLISRQWVPPTWAGKLACVAGVAAGTGTWFLGLSWAVSVGHRRFSEKTLLRMEHASGVLLLALALAHGVQIVWQLSQFRR
jgi:threonine/homoserine/homoserine lactone efflux protein